MKKKICLGARWCGDSHMGEMLPQRQACGANAESLTSQKKKANSEQRALEEAIP